MSEPRFSTPDWDAAFDLPAAVAAIPAGGTVKGMYFDNMLQLLRGRTTPEQAALAAGVPARRYTAFLDYPYTDLVRLGATVAATAFPGMPIRAGLREIGRRFYTMFAASVAGRVMFGVFGRDAERIFPLGHKGWTISINFARVHTESVARRHVRFHFVDTPTLLDTMSFGVVEGALSFCGVRGEVRIAQRDIANAVIDARWD